MQMRIRCTPILMLAIPVMAAFASPSRTMADSPVRFDSEIIPILTRYGCNGGACHGAAAGRGELQLSLYGSHPDDDYRELVEELEGRRVNLFQPADSLILLKATEQLNHGGHERFGMDSTAASRIRKWIESGARRDPAVELTDLRIATRQLKSAESQKSDESEPEFEISATATLADGSSQDVTGWVQFVVPDTSAIEFDEETHRLSLLRPGRHLMIGRYRGRVGTISIIRPFETPPTDTTKEDLSEIDQHIASRLAELGIPASGQCDDQSFLRRVTLDLTGRLPTPEAAKSFARDDVPGKRYKVIDRLLESPEFIDYWTHLLAGWLRNRPMPGESKGAHALRTWMHQQIASNRPFDELVSELVTASGDTHSNGPAYIHRLSGGPREQAEYVSEVFLGIRLRCANCHDHPLDRWTQDDYHGLSALFARVERSRIVKDVERGQVIHPRTGEAAYMQLPGENRLKSLVEPRQQLATWMTGNANPYFARSTVNRIWKHLLGRGLVEPVDDLSQTNPGTHPQLLEDLASGFRDSEYDLKALIRRIARSQAYQRSSVPLEANSTDQSYYSHFIPSRLTASVLSDAIDDVTGVPTEFGTATVRAIDLVDPLTQSTTLDILGRCTDLGACESEPIEMSPSMASQLHLLNGPLLNQKLKHKSSLLRKLIDQDAQDEEILNQLAWRAYSRAPSKEESEFWKRAVSSAQSKNEREQILEDLAWAILSSSDFVTKH